jgi:hypothetical protein
MERENFLNMDLCPELSGLAYSFTRRFEVADTGRRL